MINSFSSWLFNLMLWGGVVTFAALLYEKLDPNVLMPMINGTVALIGLGVIAVLSAVWPRY